MKDYICIRAGEKYYELAPAMRPAIVIYPVANKDGRCSMKCFLWMGCKLAKNVHGVQRPGPRCPAHRKGKGGG